MAEGGMKTPAPPTDRPLCWGLSHGHLPACPGCPVRAPCEAFTGQWARTPSLAERLSEAAVAVRDTSSLRPIEVYAALYEQHWGVAPQVRKEWTQDRVLWCEDYCTQKGYDFAVWVTAQMHMMKLFIERQRKTKGKENFGFQANMLLGEKAEYRYGVFVRRANRIHRLARDDAFKLSTFFGQLRSALYESELAVAEYYVAQYVFAGEADWDESASCVAVDPWWLAFTGKLTGEALQSQYPDTHAWYVRLRWGHGAGFFGTEVRFAQLQSAAALANTYRPGLADRIGFNKFSWEELARLLRRLFPFRKGNAADLPALGGVQWGGHKRTIVDRWESDDG